MAPVSVAEWVQFDANEVIRKVPAESTWSYGCNYTESFFKGLICGFCVVGMPFCRGLTPAGG